MLYKNLFGLLLKFTNGIEGNIRKQFIKHTLPVQNF